MCIRDRANIVGICLQFGIWMTPIMYDEAIFTSRNPWIGTVLKLNQSPVSMLSR